MHKRHRIRFRADEILIAAGKMLPAEIGGSEMLPLQMRARSPVKNERAMFQRFEKCHNSNYEYFLAHQFIGGRGLILITLSAHSCSKSINQVMAQFSLSFRRSR